MNRYLQELLKKDDIPVVFDYDGVLFEARWYVKRIGLQDGSDEALKEAMENDCSLYSEPIPYMQMFVKRKVRTKLIFVLGDAHNDIEYNYKSEQLAEKYARIKNVMWARNIDDKIKHLEAVRKRYERFIYIDDDLNALLQMERYFDDIAHCYFFHYSSLFVDFS